MQDKAYAVVDKILTTVKHPKTADFQPAIEAAFAVEDIKDMPDFFRKIAGYMSVRAGRPAAADTCHLIL